MSKINGIDVSECFYFIDHTPPKGQGDWCGAIHKGACKVYSKDCEYNKDCYFKQLARLQEENEKLKNKNNDLIEVIASGNIDIAILQKENEKLKTENEQLKKLCLVMPKVKQLAIPIEKYEKLYKALEEIRKIVEPIKENTCFGMNCGAVDWILNEINEVLNDRD